MEEAERIIYVIEVYFSDHSDSSEIFNQLGFLRATLPTVAN
jgi:hypothetical protein